MKPGYYIIIDTPEDTFFWNGTTFSCDDKEAIVFISERKAEMSLEDSREYFPSAMLKSSVWELGILLCECTTDGRAKITTKYYDKTIEGSDVKNERKLDLKQLGSLNEHQIQKSFFDWVRLNRKKPGFSCIFAIPNGGSRNIGTARKLKAEGVTPGIPDVMVPIPISCKGYCVSGLYIEFKTKKGSLSKDQKKMCLALRELGYAVEICRSSQEAINLVTEYINGAYSPKTFPFEKTNSNHER